MALLLKDSPDLVLKSGRPKRRRKAAVTEASERTLVSPLALQRPGGRLLYWLVFVLLLVSTLSTLGPLYWVFSGALKPTSSFLRRHQHSGPRIQSGATISRPGMSYSCLSIL